ncbi:MAG: hypothetical protein WC943_00875 [Elusimicrobiota bacterium]|jgi:hypothetical protein
MKGRWALWGPALVLALLNLVSFGLDAGGMGFYLDDWSLAEPGWRAADQSLWGMMKEFYNAGLAFNTSWLLRPMDIVYHPGLYWLAGLSFWKYQLAYRVMETASSVFLFLAFLKATGRPGLAFLTAALFTVFPNHGATRHWFTAAVTPAMALASAGLWCWVCWLDKGRAAFLAASLILLAAGSLTYEAVLPAAVLMPFLSYWHGLRQGLSSEGARAKAVRDSLWPGLCVAALAAYHVGIQHLGPATISRKMSFDPGFSLKALGRGFECNTTAVLHLCWVFTLSGLKELEWWRWPLAALVGALLARWMSRAYPDEPGPVGSRSWLVASGVLFVGAYAPYALSADRYIPHIFDPQNRLNVPPSLAAVMALGFGLTALPGRARTWVLAGLVAVFTVVNWENARQWKEAYRLQVSVLTGLKRNVDALPPGPAAIFLEGAPAEYKTVPVFNETFTFDSALRLFTGRRDLKGSIMVGGRAERSYPEIKARYRYRHPEGVFTAEP